MGGGDGHAGIGTAAGEAASAGRLDEPEARSDRPAGAGAAADLPADGEAAEPDEPDRPAEPRRRGGQVPREVGKSDNAAEPHRYISAQMETSNEAPLSDEPLWFTVKDDFLVRNEGVDISPTEPFKRNRIVRSQELVSRSVQEDVAQGCISPKAVDRLRRFGIIPTLLF